MCLSYLSDCDSRLLTASSLRHYGLLCGRHVSLLLYGRRRCNLLLIRACMNILEWGFSISITLWDGKDGS